MLNSSIFLWSASALVGLGLWILSRLFLSSLADLGFGLLNRLRRLLRPRLAGWLSEFRGEASYSQETVLQVLPGLIFSRLLDLPLAWTLFSLVLASVAHDRMFSPVLLTFGMILGEVVRSERSQRRRMQLNDDASRLIVQFEARYPLLHSVRNTLEKSTESLPERELRRFVTGCLQKIRVGKPIPEALAGLKKLPVPSLGQLAVVLSAAQEASPEVFLESLQMLKRDVEDRLLLHNQVRQSLTLLRGTVRILQIVLLLSMLAASSLPSWRYYFVSDPANWVKLLLALLVGAGGSLYVEAEIRLLEVG
jgi:hypothetical protein